MNIDLIKAETADVDVILDIMDMARNYQRSLGFIQWEDDYPNRAIIEQDITMGDAYVFIQEDKIVGYCVLPIGDSAYDELSNTWHNKGEYGVVHRLAFSDKIRGKGYSTIAFDLVEKNFKSRGIDFIRIDTGEENIVMQHVLDRCHYLSHGVKLFPWGLRIAYEKNISHD